MGLGTIFSFLDKLIDKLPIQDRKERLKNKIDDLERKRSAIIIMHPNINNSKRLGRLHTRLSRLHKKISNFE